MPKSPFHSLFITSLACTFIILILLLSSFYFKNTFAQSNLQDLVYQSPSFGIKINYPADWKANSDEADPKAEKSTIVTFIPKLNVNDTDGAVKVWVNNNPPTYNLMSFLQNEINNDRKTMLVILLVVLLLIPLPYLVLQHLHTVIQQK